MKTPFYLMASAVLAACSDAPLALSPSRAAADAAITPTSDTLRCGKLTGELRGEIELQSFSFGSTGESSGSLSGHYRLTLHDGRRAGGVLQGPGSLIIDQTTGSRIDLACFIVTKHVDQATPQLSGTCALRAAAVELSFTGAIQRAAALFLAEYHGARCRP